MIFKTACQYRLAIRHQRRGQCIALETIVVTTIPAERNALINAARMGIQTKDCYLYMDCGVPCTPCLVEIINAGIKEIIITELKFYDQSSQYLLKEADDLQVRLYSSICEHDDVLRKNGLSFPTMKGHCPDCGMKIGEEK